MFTHVLFLSFPPVTSSYYIVKSGRLYPFLVKPWPFQVIFRKAENSVLFQIMFKSAGFFVSILSTPLPSQMCYTTHLSNRNVLASVKVNGYKTSLVSDKNANDRSSISNTDKLPYQILLSYLFVSFVVAISWGSSCIVIRCCNEWQ